MPTYINDPFTRTVSDSWGTEPVTGSAYGYIGTQTDFDVSNGTATASTVAGQARFAGITLTPTTLYATARVQLNTLPSGNTTYVGMAARHNLQTTAVNAYYLRINWTTTNTITMQFQKIVNDVTSAIGSTKTLTGVTQAANTAFGVGFRLEGTTSVTLYGKFWLASGTEPGWDDANLAHTTTDATPDAAIQGAGAIGLRGGVNASGAPTTFTWDDFFVTNGTPSPTSMVLRPDGDRTIGGHTTQSGGTTNLFTVLNEAVANDANYIQSPSGAGAYTYECSLANLEAEYKIGTGTVTVAYRYGKDQAAGAQVDQVISLRQGTTLLASNTHTNVGVFPVAGTLTVSASSITNVQDLRLRFVSTVVAA